MRLKVLLMIFVLLVFTVTIFSSYAIRNGDMLAISVYGRNELNSEVFVGPDGYISVSPIGQVYAKDKTLPELEQILAERYSEVLASKPQLTVSVSEYAPFIFSVLGEAKHPGSFKLERENVTISRMLSEAGGLTDYADAANAFIIKENNERISIDLSKVENTGDNADFILKTGSTLFIPSAYEKSIRAIGEFSNPKVIRFYEGITLTQVIAEAGGLKETADLEEIVVLTRKNGSVQRRNYDLNRIFEGMIPDPLLEKGSSVIAGDISNKSVRVLGELVNPGIVLYKKGLTLMKAIGNCDGLTPNNSGEAIVINEDNTQYSINIDKLFSGEIEDPELRAGDTVVVPRQEEKYVYLVSPEETMRMDFSLDEKITLKNVLIKAKTYDPEMNFKITVRNGTGKQVVNSKDLIEDDIPLSSGVIVQLPLTSKFIYMLGEVEKPGTINFENFESAELGIALAKAGGLKETAGEVEIVSSGETYRFAPDDAVKSEHLLKPGDIVFVSRMEEKFVYIISKNEGGRIEFTKDEKLTLRNALSKRNLLLAESTEIVEVLMPDDSRLRTELRKILEDDILLKPGSVIIYPEVFKDFYVTGAVKSPGLIEIDSNQDITLSKILSLAGGLQENADNVLYVTGQEKADNFEMNNLPEKDIIKELGFSERSVIYVPEVPERFVYVITGNEGGKVSFSKGEKLTLKTTLAKLNLLDVSDSSIVTVIDSNGEKEAISGKKLREEDIEIANGSIVRYPDGFSELHVLGEVNQPGTISFSNRTPTLLTAISRAGGLKIDANETEVLLINSITGDSSTTDLSELIDKKDDIELFDGTTIYIPREGEKYVYLISPESGGKITFEPDEKLTLKNTLARFNLLNLNSERSVTIQQPDGEKKEIPVKELHNKDEKLVPGTTVVVPELRIKVNVLGAVQKPGTVYFEQSEKLSVVKAISKVGGLLENASGILELIKDDTKTTVQLSDIINEKAEISISDEMIIYAQSAEGRYVYMITPESGRRISFGPDEQLTLRNALSKVSLLTFASDEIIELLLPNGKRTSVKFSALREKDLELEPGTVIVCPDTKSKIYVLGAVVSPGVKLFPAANDPTLLEAISESNGTLPEALENRVKIINSEGIMKEVNLERIYNGLEVNPLLTNETMIYVPEYEPIRVSVLGQVNNPSVVTFEKEENPTILKAIAKCGGLSEKAGELVRISGSESEYNWMNLVSVNDVDLKDGMILYIPRVEESFIYVTGEVSRPGIINFDRFERLTLAAALAKAGDPLESAGNFVKTVGPDGVMNEYELLDVMQGKIVTIEPGTTVIVNKGIEKITVLGEVKSPGMLTFTAEESTSPMHVLGKAGGIVDESKVNRILVKSSNGSTESYDVNEFLSADIVLEDGDIVYAESAKEFSFSVLGEVKNPGSFSYQSKMQPTLGNIISRAGGLLETAKTIKIFSGNDVIEEYSPDILQSREQVELNRDSFIYVVSSDEKRVAILGDVNNPGLFESIAFGRTKTLSELLSEAGGLKTTSGAWISIISLNNEVVNTNFSAQDTEILSREINPGSTIYVRSAPLKVYVFGAVKNPGAIEFTPDMTVIEAILGAGGFTPNAKSSNTLIFKGNYTEEKPDFTTVDLSVKPLLKLKVDTNIYLEPNYVVYVPQTLYVNIKEIVSFLGDVLSVVSSGISIGVNTGIINGE
ncbi:MAG: SLBB domain-containing protein [Kosmotogaceae bacterium]